MTATAVGSEDDGALPERCHVVLPGLPAGANVAVCVRGERGVRMTRMDLGDATLARPIVRAFNESLGIDLAAEHAMLAGCLIGWHSELADPEFLRVTDRRFVGCIAVQRPPLLH